MYDDFCAAHHVLVFLSYVLCGEIVLSFVLFCVMLYNEILAQAIMARVCVSIPFVFFRPLLLIRVRGMKL